MGAALGGQDRRIAHQRGDRGGVEGGGHHQQHQFGPQRRAELQRQGQPQVGLQAALVEFVEDQAADARQIGVRLDHPGEDTFGDHLDPRPGDRLAADAVADPGPDLLAQAFGQALGGGAGGDPARLEHQDAA